MKATNVTKKYTKEQIVAILKNQDLSKSAKIRALFDGGLELKEIATLIDVRYNFVYNVLQNHIIQNDIPVERVERDHKRDEIIALLQSGKTLVEVCKATKSVYNYVWKISKELKQAAAAETKKEAK